MTGGATLARLRGRECHLDMDRGDSTDDNTLFAHRILIYGSRRSIVGYNKDLQSYFANGAFVPRQGPYAILI